MRGYLVCGDYLPILEGEIIAVVISARRPVLFIWSVRSVWFVWSIWFV